jgi:cob(I)alamin adenosyltransferase
MATGSAKVKPLGTIAPEAPEAIVGDMGITTKRGDEGETDLASGRRVRKDELLIEALGELDELVSRIGFALQACRQAETRSALDRTQRDLFRAAAMLASDGSAVSRPIGAAEERDLSAGTAELEARLGLRGFVLPGRTEASARIDLARASARALERRAVALGEPSAPRPLLAYLNRLSDFLFVLARTEEAAEGRIEYL